MSWFYSLCSPLPYWTKLICVPNKIIWKWLGEPGGKVAKNNSISFILLWEKVSYSSQSELEFSSIPMERPTWQGIEGSYQQAGLTCQVCEWTLLTVDHPAPVKPSHDCNPRQHLNRHLMKEPEPEPLS